MTTKRQELMLFGGWAKMQRVTITENGVSIDSVVVSLSIFRLEMRILRPPKLARYSRLLFGGSAQVQLLALTTIEIIDDDHKLSIEVQESPYLWERTYLPIGRKLWWKLEKFYNRGITAKQLELWQNDEGTDHEEIRVSVEVSPLLHPTNQVLMLWVIRLELRKRIRAFHWPRRHTFHPHSEVIQEFLHYLM